MARWVVVILLSAGPSVSAFGQVIESPTTAARGAWLIEADVGFGVWDRSGRGSERVEFREIGALPVLLSTGVTGRWDLQIGFDGWIEATLETSTGKERISGWGDAYVRTKWNFSGDEEMGPAWAVLPYLKIPVADGDIGNGDFEGGGWLCCTGSQSTKRAGCRLLYPEIRYARRWEGGMKSWPLGRFGGEVFPLPPPSTRKYW